MRRYPRPMRSLRPPPVPTAPSAARPSPIVRIAAAAAPLRQQVVSAVRDAVAEGRYLPGERLVERELCELMGVSRTCLREALRELENDGIVTSVPNRGVVVSTIGLRDAREIYEMRAMLEGLLAERFARLASSAHLAALEQAVEALAEAYDSGSGLLEAKRAFYEALMGGADHDLAASMLRSIQLRASQLRNMTLSDPDRARHSIAEIRQLLKAVKKRDPVAAQAAAHRHVQNAGALALRLLERAAPQAASGG